MDEKREKIALATIQKSAPNNPKLPLRNTQLLQTQNHQRSKRSIQQQNRTAQKKSIRLPRPRILQTKNNQQLLEVLKREKSLFYLIIFFQMLARLNQTKSIKVARKKGSLNG